MRVFALLMAMVMACCICSPVFAGDLDPAAAPGSTSSYTLEDLWNRLNDGTVGSESFFTEPTSGPTTGTGHTLNQIMGVAPDADDTDGATSADVANGKKFWGLTSGEWGLQTGTASGCFTCSGTLSDGGRWCDQGNGTVRDMTTGLVWLQNANCIGRKVWADAVGWASILYDGSTSFSGGDCNLSDGSVKGDWRLPTLSELKILTTGTEAISYGSPDPFTNVQFNSYWSSSFYAVGISAYHVSMYNGVIGYGSEGTAVFVLPVRGGQ